MRKKSWFLLLVFSFSCSVTQAAIFADESPGYDSIIDELRTESTPTPRLVDPFDEIAIHFGFGVAASYTRFVDSQAINSSGFLNGLELNVGLDLFSPQWVAQGTFRDYGKTKLGQTQVGLQEYDLCVLYRPQFATSSRFVLGLGVAARYLTLTSGDASFRYSTPASLFILGFETSVAKGILLSPQISYRSTMVEDSPDRYAMNTSLTLGLQF